MHKKQVDCKSLSTYKGGPYPDFYICTKSNHYFLIDVIFKQNEVIYFEGREIQCTTNLSDFAHGVRLDLEYILNAKILSGSRIVPVNEISELVMFVPAFEINSSNQPDLKTGFVIKSTHLVHN